MISRCFALAALCALAGCSLPAVGAGESCRRSTECKPGLGCVRGKCSKDLGPIADESTVPDLGLGMGDAAAQGGMGGAAGAPAAGSGGG